MINKEFIRWVYMDMLKHKYKIKRIDNFIFMSFNGGRWDKVIEKPWYSFYNKYGAKNE